jgi:malonyl-CoA/methylmalonyl-CoA synthetase
MLPNAEQRSESLAIVDSSGNHTYGELLEASERIALALLDGRNDLAEARIAFLLPPGLPWVATLWGIWRAGGVAVPLPLQSTRPELEYVIADTAASALVSDTNSAGAIEGIAADRGITVHLYSELAGSAAAILPAVSKVRRAMILYTSGTTSKPKGVVTTHANIAAQVGSLLQAWGWTSSDRTVLCLPLHHVHGIINIVSCSLWSGACCEMLPRFDANVIWDRIASGAITIFMAVPTIYVRLIAAFDAATPDRQRELSAAAAKLRLMVSGSAALPVSTLERWREITGHTLLERYGMTEIGMALSNPLRGTRVPGSVGVPLPSVEVQLVGEDGSPVQDGGPGEIEVRGPNVFAEYWGKPEATRDTFREGWFRTGDTAVIENGVYRILGRTSIDILKTGGHKVSALEIEETLRQHHAIAECAVVGIADPEWGERIAAAVVLREGTTLDLASLRTWARESLTAHKLPSRLLILDALPRNAMGKVVKPSLAPLFKAQL